MSIPGNANPLLLKQAAAGGYQIERSLRFNSSDSAFCSRVPSTAGNRKTWTWAGWVKRSGLAGNHAIFGEWDSSGVQGVACQFLSNDKIRLYDFATSSADWTVDTSAVFRDPSAWFHFVVVVDTTQATASNRVKLYVNGLQSTLESTTYPSQNLDTRFNRAQETAIGRGGAWNNYYLPGYLADIHFIDGQALTPSSFTEVSATTGQLIPIAYTGTYGTNGFHLPFSDNSTAAALGTDTSGNGNTWTVNNLSVTAGAGNDSLVDTPTSYGTDTGAGGEVRGNYATLNPLNKATNVTLSDGSLRGDQTSSVPVVAQSTIGMSTGKWYCEFVQTAASAGSLMFGLNRNIDVPNTQGNPYYAYFGGGQKFTASSGTAYGATWGTNDVIGVGFDADNGSLTFYKNGVSQGTAFTGLTAGGPYFFAAGANGATFTYVANFGQRPFAYAAPSGFKALCDTNLPAPVVAKPNEVMDVKLYTGNGSTQTISGLNFSPDLVWVKRRDDSNSSGLFDVVRGAGARLISDATNAEFTDATFGSFNTDGFSLTDGDTPFNTSGGTYVAWTWDAGSSTVTNTQGSITSQVRANASAGFSVVTYTGNGSAGATIGHGLGVAPQMIIVKNRDAADAWQVYHSANTANPETDYLVLNTTAATADNVNRWNDTAPTSTLFTLGNGAEVNTNTEDYVAYCWTGLDGYSSFGSYTGNGSADGPFVYTGGFKPRWLMIKRTDSTGSWIMWDTSRTPYNLAENALEANSSNAESSGWQIDLLSNGFKSRNVGTQYNASGGTYVWAAFAENPFQYARAR